MRSLLFVPGDSDRKQAKSLDSGADALLLDLEDSVAAQSKPKARAMTRDFLQSARTKTKRPRLYVRTNSLPTGLVDTDSKR
jgi:citrate lyase subunit beta/citryl-CoA lyase